ncbi:hypothetical protein D1816_08450 [Aquimarina sp. AD10]|uniref:hypothetical protein n=1 Tax=Aquimarina sp. AD10 TaxID=1714849 RepID=UPI000E48318D|nr:hypothetical protein [Aquimarina sp. AD10]AXT60378.1 hypothetical protein D1816_08450 [Aquimarina sp. AD10]RKN01187.1 hypothetical protein D7033_05030 [Aquimarina sp. AD10]
MKTTIFKLSTIALVLVIISTACEKPEEIIHEETNIINDEGFRSKTEHHDEELSEQQESILPLLHMSFDNKMNKEITELHWNEAVKNFFKRKTMQNKVNGTIVYFQISTQTGNHPYNNTNAIVQASVDFDHDFGTYNSGYLTLNNPNNDRELGQTDLYLLGICIPYTGLSWIELERANIRLQGEDGWFITSYNVSLLNSNQVFPASGSSFISTTPNTWLDNITNTGWDYYNTTSVGLGTLLL